MNALFRFTIVYCLLIAACLTARAQVRLPQLVSDGMVLQRDVKVKIWGWASPAERVSVSFNGEKYTAETDKDGKWTIMLEPLKAGGPYEMDINASNQIVIKDIMVGDVWFCSGQSNMVLPMERVKEKYADDIPAADNPEIRNFFVSTLADLEKVHDDLPAGKWLKATPKNVLTFGAASFFFARQLYNKYHVPIGLINSSVGGTPIQAWISGEGLKGVSQYANRLKQFKDTAHLNSLLRLPKNVFQPVVQKPDIGSAGPKTWYDTTYHPEGWHPFWLPGYWNDQGVKDLNGVVWFRKEINVPSNMAGQPAKIFMGRIVDADFLYVNGVLCGSTAYQYPPRRYEVKAGILKPGKNIIVIRVINNTGKGGFVPDKPYYLLSAGQQIDLRGDWQYKVGQVFLPQKLSPSFSAQGEPTGLYNAMVAPVTDYAIKGVLWYQGEANTSKPREYAQLMGALIADWRTRRNNPQLPFLYVQLPGYMEVQYLPSESQWAELREAQLKTLSVPNTGMAVTIDAGEWNDIHPLDKKDVGERLALLARKIAYGDDNLVASGPIYQSAQIKAGKIIITFTATGSGLTTKDGGPLTQFAIAGDDKKFVWADAVIEGDKVIVSSEEIPNPAYVRYAWADNPDGANLCNKEGLLASPFTTEEP
jgi:sialate O-acetylesterase